METLTRLVAESLARHGFDRPVDYRRLQWSRWFRCESHHSLLTVPSKPGVFAIAEEIMDITQTTERVGTAASAVPRSGASTSDQPIDMEERRLNKVEDRHLNEVQERRLNDVDDRRLNNVEERRFSAASSSAQNGALAPAVESRRMLAVTQFYEDDDMAFVLDRMLSHENPMRGRLACGRYFVRYVVIEDTTQRRSICNALNQWIVSSAEKATGIGSHFASSLELPNADSTHEAKAASPAQSEAKGNIPTNVSNPIQSDARRVNSAPTLNSAIATNIHCSSSFPSGF